MKSGQNAVILTICLLVLSCNTYKRDKFYYRGQIKSSSMSWINNFKDEVFYECLKEGYKNDSIFKLMSKKDLFNTSDGGMTLDDYNSIRILGRKIIKNMPPPYIHIDDEDISGMNFISASCLHYYASRELDSIAKAAYKNHVKMEKENDMFWKNYKP
jgi:hypothetical protein